MKLGISGLGNIGKALYNGLSNNINIHLSAYGKNRDQSQNALLYNSIKKSNEEIINSSDIILLCVRTDQVEDYLSQYSSLLANKIIVFFQAGFELEALIKYKADKTVFIRAITNINVAARNGYTVLLKNEFAKEYLSVLELLKSVGEVKEVETESELESIALLPGCSPAIVALLVHYLEDISQKYGIDKNSNKDAIFATVSGTIVTMRQSENTSLEIAKSVASPSGKVEKAIAEIIDSQNFEQVLTNFFDEITKHK